MPKPEIENGAVIRYDENGSISSIQQYTDGKLNGQTRFYKNRELIQTKEYKNNVLHGIVQSFKDGSLILLEHYQDGLKNGTTYIYKDLYPMITREYKNDKKHGLEISYMQGCVMKVQRYIEDVLHGYYYQYYPTGTLLERGCFRDGMLDGEVVMFDKTMKVIKQTYYKSGVKMS